jgi:hypothetical protein
MTNQDPSKSDSEGLTIGDAKGKLRGVQHFLKEPGVTGVGISIREGAPAMILSVKDDDAAKLYNSRVGERVGPQQLPMYVEVEQYSCLTSSHSDAMIVANSRMAPRMIQPDEGWVIGLWHRLTRPFRGISTLFVP